MKTLCALALVLLVLGCHIDKLLNGGGGKTPPSEAPPARVAFSSSLSSARAGEPISPPVQVTVQDSAGRVTLRDTLVTLSLGANPSGDSLRGTKQVRSVNGVATFANLRLDKAASGYTLTAAAPALHPDTSGAFSVMPAPATELLFTVQPSSAMQDSAIKPPLQVTAYDSLGNKATNFAGSIRLGIGTDGSVSKNAGIAGAVASAVAGVATFPDVRINQVGVGYTLTAAFGTTAPVDTSVAFDITPGPPPPPPPPTHLGFTQQPQTTQAGATITPPVQVAALDASEHVVQGFTGAITLALGANSGGGTLSGGAPVSAVNGVATFPNLSVDQPGNGYTLRATSSGLTAATSNAFNATAPPPTTGDLTVIAATTGSSQPASYTVTVDGGSSRTISANGGTTTYTGLSATSHTVALTDVPANCTASGGVSHTVTVTAGQTTTEPFSISCVATTGALTVSTTTTGADQPSGYTVSVTAGGSQTIGATGSIAFNGLATGSHTVTLSGAPSNCSVSGGTSQTVNVAAGQTATASFSISCTALTGSLTVTTATSGSNPPSGYTVTLDGGQSRILGLNTSTTYTGLTATSHTVQLNGIPTNCSVSEANPQTVTVPAGGTAQASFTITCTAPNQPPSVSAGSDQTVLVGGLFTLTGAGFSDPDHDGPWTVTIDWGDGTSSTSTSPGEGSIGGSHSYPVTLLAHDYQLTVTVVDAHGGRGSATKTVHVVLS